MGGGIAERRHPRINSAVAGLGATAPGFLKDCNMPNYSSGGTFQPSADYQVTGTWNFTQPLVVAAASAGTVPATTVVAAESGIGAFHQTVLAITNLAMSINDTHVGGGTKIYTFPEGVVTVLGATATVTPTTTSVIASTLNSGVTLSVGVGSVQTVTQDSGTLATTEQDIVNAFSATSSTTINVAGTAGSGLLSATTSLKYDGHTTAQAVYLNCGVPTATDIDANATTTWTGTVTITWVFSGDF